MKGRDYLEELDVDGSILKNKGVKLWTAWTDLSKVRFQRRSAVNTVMNHCVA
jgi:hypothetical protein